MTIPYKFKPRPYQLKILQAMDSGMKRAIMIWNRRSGKDKVCFNIMVKKALEQVGSYYYAFPEYNQGRKALWETIGSDKLRILDHIPPTLIRNFNNHEMKIELVNGSIIRVIGVSDINSILGTNPIGIVFSEYSLQNPTAWDFLRPILAENGGWAIFNFTPRGKMNCGYQLYKDARDDPTWFTQILTIDDSKVLSPEALAQEKKELFLKYGDDSFFKQEYYCSFEANVLGSIYGGLMEIAFKEKRIGNIMYDKAFPVNTWWDIGYNDATSITFQQMIGNEIRIIDHEEDVKQSLTDWIAIVREKGYNYGTHNAPHDMNVHEYSTGTTRNAIALQQGFYFNILPAVSDEEGINAVRTIFNRLYINEEKCPKLIAALHNYHYEYDELNRQFKSKPKEDWSNHAADTLKYMAYGLTSITAPAEASFSYLDYKY